MNLAENLSRYFRTYELVRTEHRSIDNTPPTWVLGNLRHLCQDFLDHIRVHFGAIWVSSGFRCRTLNTVIGGATDSAHLYGCAADIIPIEPGVHLDDIMTWVARDSGLPFDQLILECTPTGGWVHLGILRPDHEEKEPRLEVLRFEGGRYSPWVPAAVGAIDHG